MINKDGKHKWKLRNTYLLIKKVKKILTPLFYTYDYYYHIVITYYSVINNSYLNISKNCNDFVLLKNLKSPNLNELIIKVKLLINFNQTTKQFL